MAETEQMNNTDVTEDGMSFWDHLEVLRWALFRVLCAFFVLFCVTLWAMPHIFDKFVLGPTTSNFFVYRWVTELSHGLLSFNEGFAVEIININVASQFMTHITTAMTFAAVLAFPYLAYEVWRYIKPALFDNEIRHVRAAFLGGTVMFYLGCAIGYTLVFPFTFRFLTEYELSAAITNQINLQSYINNFTTLIMVMGIVFEMPLLAWLLSALGILRRQMLQQYRRHAVVVLMVLSAFITPSGDPFTLMLVFVPLYMLYELSVLVVAPSKEETEE